MDYNLKSHFYLKKDKINAKGEAPVYLRLTLNRKRTAISTNNSIVPGNWNKNAERAKGNREEARIFNSYLDSISSKVKRCLPEM